MFSSEDSDSNSSSRNVWEAGVSENEGDFGVVGGLVEPYRFEPVAPEGYEEPDEEEDEDGLTPAIFELSFERFSLEARLPAGVRENEPVLKRKSPPTGIQAMEYTFR